MSKYTVNSIKKHNDLYCLANMAKVLPDENGNCSLCGATLIPLAEPERTAIEQRLFHVAIDTFTGNADVDQICEQLSPDEQDVYREVCDMLWAKEQLEELRKALRAENISYGELAELQSLAKYIEPGDVELLEAAGVPEFDEEN